MDNDKIKDENLEDVDLIDESKEDNNPSDETKEEIIDGEIVEDDLDDDISTEDIEEDFNEFKDKYQRLLADFTNYKQREEASKADFKKYATSNLVEKLLPVLDNFDRALAGAKDDDALAKGVEMTRDEMLRILENEGLELIRSDGEAFDYNLHQAVLTEESNEVESDHIIETLQKGYKLNSKVIRPAMVKVAK